MSNRCFFEPIRNLWLSHMKSLLTKDLLNLAVRFPYHKYLKKSQSKFQYHVFGVVTRSSIWKLIDIFEVGRLCSCTLKESEGLPQLLFRDEVIKEAAVKIYR